MTAPRGPSTNGHGPPDRGIPRRHTTPGFQRLVRWTSGLVMKVVARLDVQGLENIPASGFVGVSNHLSSFDPFPVLASVPIRPATAFAAVEHRRDFFIGWVLDRLGTIWIDREEPGREAIRIALNELKMGTALGVAPEGTRSRTAQLLPGKTGAVFLATRAGVPILPAAIWGTERIRHNLRRLQRTEVHFHIGQLVHLPEGRADAQQLEEYTETIMCRIAALLPPEYRGAYAGKVA